MSNAPESAVLEAQLRERYGLLLTVDELAELLGRTPAGLRWSLAHPADVPTAALRDCARRIGRRRYYPVRAVAAALAGEPR